MTDDITHGAAREAVDALFQNSYVYDVAWPAKSTLSAYIAQCEKREALLSDPVAVHANMLRGGIAMPTPEAIEHLYQDRLPSVAEASRLRSLLNEAGEVLTEVSAGQIDVSGTAYIYDYADATPMMSRVRALSDKLRSVLSDSKLLGGEDAT